MSVQRELLGIAMLGTARGGSPRDRGTASNSRLDRVLDAAREDDPARTLLKQAAIVAVSRRAGRRSRLEAGLSLLPPAMSEERLRCTEPAARRLASMLDGPRQRFLPEWFAAIERAGQRAPEEYLPSLLDLATRRKEWREPIRSVLGRRGEWLAQINSAWSWAVAAVEPATPRPGARPADEATVRRMIERVRPLLDYRSLPLHRDVIEVRLPSQLDQSMKRDGIAATPAIAGVGERQWWLRQMLARIPPGFWCVLWNRSERELVRAAARSEWRSLLLDGWTEAVPLDPTVGWIEALLDERLEEQTEDGIDIFDLLPAERQEAYLIKALQRSSALAVDQPAFWFLTRSRHSWGKRVARILLPLLRREREIRQTRAIWDWEELLRLAGQRLDPRLAPEAAALLSEEAKAKSPLAPALAEFLDDLEFRAEMIEEIKR